MRFVQNSKLSLIRLFWAQLSLIRGNLTRTWVWSEVISSALESDQRRLRADITFCAERGIWSHTSLIRGESRAHTFGDIFERTYVWTTVLKTIGAKRYDGVFWLTTLWRLYDLRPFQALKRLEIGQELVRVKVAQKFWSIDWFRFDQFCVGGSGQRQGQAQFGRTRGFERM